jgi:hypothetical protein
MRENCLQLCLENWAQRLYRAEPEKQAKLEQVFRALAFKEPNSRTYTQQRVGFDELIALLDLEDETGLHALLHAWLSPHCYLYWDKESRTIKVAHESFIRGWSEFPSLDRRRRRAFPGVRAVAGGVPAMGAKRPQ